MFSFCKIQATGNDYIIINYIERKFEYSFKLLSQFLCDRHFGVGADSVIILDTGREAKFKIKEFDRYGREKIGSANAIRAIAKYVYDNSLIYESEFEIETKNEIKKVKVYAKEGCVEEIEIEVGKESCNLEDIPAIYLENNYQGKIYINNLEIYLISIRNSFAVCFVDEVSKVDIRKLGGLIENYKYFPEKINVVFCEIINKDKLKLRIWEKDIGEVLSNGEAACAAAITGYRYKSTNKDINVDLPGGNLKILCDKIIKLRGPAINVFCGNIEI